MISLGRMLLSVRPGRLNLLAHTGTLPRTLAVNKQGYRTSAKSLYCQISTRERKAEESLEAENDLILGELSGATNTSDILVAIEQHHLAMTNRHLLASFQILGGKVEKGDTLPQSIVESPSFLKLANRTLKRLRFYEVGECVTLLKAAALLKLPTKSSLVQGICQMIRASLKDLSLKQLMFLHFLLTRFEGQTFLTEALRTAIPLVFQLKCPVELDTANFEESFQALRFALSSECDKDTLEFISLAMQKHANDMSAVHAVNLMSAVAFVKTNKVNTLNIFDSKAFRHLLDTCMDIVASGLDKLDMNNLRMLLSTLSYTGFTRKLCDSLWQFAEDNHWSLARTTTLAFSTQQHRYFTVRNSKFLRDLIIKEKDEVLNNERIPLPVLSNAVATLAAQERFPGLKSSSGGSEEAVLNQKAAAILADAKEKATRLSSNLPSFITYMRDLVVTGIFPTFQLDMLFNPQVQEAVLQNEFVNVTIAQRLLDIEYCIRLRGEKASRFSFRILPRIRFRILNKFETHHSESQAIHKALATALEGEKFVAERICTPLGTLADFLMVLRPNGLPIALSHYAESDRHNFFKTIPNECRVLAVLLTNNASYLRASGLPTVDLSLRTELLRAQKISPLLINVNNWIDLMDNERVPFIQRELKAVLACSDAYRAHIDGSAVN
ncbi:uncharacterized protein LOC111270697 [Varroa jacobsoni]|uniref:uncharacterized protein LOC111270697 n=1 Tax=Varroa jacobsoni TaxID=62625 RepID=UPI000BF7A825|nr:uncharacterized protein LOC111270697 [Varroa jacobsoni]